MSLPSHTVILWRCPRCGGTDPDTSQSARVCSRTKACAKVKRSGIIEYTRMERVAYAPYDLLVDYFTAADWYRRCLEDIQDGRSVAGLKEARTAFAAADMRVRDAMGEKTVLNA